MVRPGCYCTPAPGAGDVGRVGQVGAPGGRGQPGLRDRRLGPAPVAARLAQPGCLLLPAVGAQQRLLERAGGGSSPGRPDHAHRPVSQAHEGVTGADHRSRGRVAAPETSQLSPGPVRTGTGRIAAVPPQEARADCSKRDVQSCRAPRAGPGSSRGSSENEADGAGPGGAIGAGAGLGTRHGRVRSAGRPGQTPAAPETAARHRPARCRRPQAAGSPWPALRTRRRLAGGFGPGTMSTPRQKSSAQERVGQRRARRAGPPRPLPDRRPQPGRRGRRARRPAGGAGGRRPPRAKTGRLPPVPRHPRGPAAAARPGSGVARAYDRAIDLAGNTAETAYLTRRRDQGWGTSSPARARPSPGPPTGEGSTARPRSRTRRGRTAHPSGVIAPGPVPAWPSRLDPLMRSSEHGGGRGERPRRPTPAVPLPVATAGNPRPGKAVRTSGKTRCFGIACRGKREM